MSEVVRKKIAGAAPNLPITGLTGGNSGCLCYLAASGVVRDLDNSMRAKLRDNAPIFFKHPNGNYYLISTGQMGGLTGLTGAQAMALKQKVSKTDTNVTYYDPNSAAAYAALAPSTFQAYLEPGRTLNTTDVVFNLIMGSIRFADTSGTPAVTVQDKIIIGNSAGQYGNLAGMPSSSKWAQPWAAASGGNSYGDANTAHAPSGGILQWGASGLTAATNVATGNVLDGGSQAVLTKDDGNVSNFYWLHRISGTAAAPVGVGIRAHLDNTVANRAFSVGYFGGSTAWVDCTDPACGPKLDPAFTANVGYRYVIDVIGTFVGAKIWQTNSTEPSDYTVWGWQSAVINTGAVGVVVTGGTIILGDYGSYAASPASAPRGP